MRTELLTSLVHFSSAHPHRLKCTTNHPLNSLSQKPTTHTQPFTFSAPDPSVSLGYISKIHQWPAHLSLALVSLQSNHHDATSQWARLFPLFFFFFFSFHSYLPTISSPPSSWSLENQVTFLAHSKELHRLDCGWLSSTGPGLHFEMLFPSLHLCFRFTYSEAVARSWPLHLLWPSVLSFFHQILHMASSRERSSSD